MPRLPRSRGNGIAKHLDGATALFTAVGPESYISPDWYAEGPAGVSTWNYVAVELEGSVAAVDEDGLRRHLEQLGDEQEAKLPKQTWRLDKVDAATVAKLLRAITGFRLTFTAWRGTFKMNQNKSPEARLAVANALDGPCRRSVGALMRATG